MSTRVQGLVECVINVSEGRDQPALDALTRSAGRYLLDFHSDWDHHRCVLTLAGDPSAVQESARAVAVTAVSLIDLRAHSGIHPRLGALDVVPWVALGSGPGHRLADGDEGHRLADGDPAVAEAERNRFAEWAAETLSLPCFLYGSERSLPEIRRSAFAGLSPDRGPVSPHPTAGAVAVGARRILVAYNLWLAEPDLDLARTVAASIRSRGIRALGLRVGDHVQVSCNLIDPWSEGPGDAYDAVSSRAAVARAELVGLAPLAVVENEPRRRWPELGLDRSSTIEARLEKAGLDGGRF